MISRQSVGRTNYFGLPQQYMQCMEREREREIILINLCVDLHFNFILTIQSMYQALFQKNRITFALSSHKLDSSTKNNTLDFLHPSILSAKTPRFHIHFLSLELHLPESQSFNYCLQKWLSYYDFIKVRKWAFSDRLMDRFVNSRVIRRYFPTN